MRLPFASSAAFKQPATLASKLAPHAVEAPLKRQSPAAAAAARGWSIRSSGTCTTLTAPAPAVPADESCTLQLPFSHSITLDLELADEEAQCIAQPPPATDICFFDATVTAAKAARPVGPRMLLRRAALASMQQLVACMHSPAVAQ
ncbi:hypothetical protein ABPG75_013627 [Micractinium tetrahymenae]